MTKFSKMWRYRRTTRKVAAQRRDLKKSHARAERRRWTQAIARLAIACEADIVAYDDFVVDDPPLNERDVI